VGSTLTRCMCKRKVIPCAQKLPFLRVLGSDHYLITLLKSDGIKLICFIDIINYGWDRIYLFIYFTIQVSDRLSVC
jgi:hypothetical protein